MPVPTTIVFDSDLTLEQRADALCAVHRVIKQAGSRFNVVTNRAESTIARTAQDTAHQRSRVIMIDLGTLALPARGALTLLNFQERVELFDGNAVTEPQVPRALRSKPLQRIRLRRGGCAARAARSLLALPTRSSTRRALRYFRPGRVSTTKTTEPNLPIPLHEGISAMRTQILFLGRTGASSTAHTATETSTVCSADTAIDELSTASGTFVKLARLAAKAPPRKRPHKRFLALCAFSTSSHSSKVSLRSDKHRTARPGGTP